MLLFLDQRAREAADERWQRALEALLACVDCLNLSAEAAKRWAITRAAEEVEDRIAELSHWGRRAA